MRKALITILSVIVLAFLIGCSGGGDNGNGGTAPTTVINLSGMWTGGGTYYVNDMGDSLNMDYTLVLNLAHNGSQLTGNFTITRPVLGTRTNTVNGTAANGVIFLKMGCCWTLEGTYTENTITFELVETFAGGDIEWIKANGTVTR
jgi:hypothetical protein